MSRHVTSCSTCRPASQTSACVELDQRHVGCCGARQLPRPTASRDAATPPACAAARSCASRSTATTRPRVELEVTRRSARGRSSGTCAAQTSVHSLRDELEHRVELAASRGDRARSRARRATSTVGSNATPRAISTRRCSPRDSSRKRARRELGDAEPPQHGERALALAGRRPAARHVGAVDARQHDVERREVPAACARNDPGARDRRARSRCGRARRRFLRRRRSRSGACRAPARARSCPAIRPSNVLLPLPFAPTMPQCSPRASCHVDVVQHGSAGEIDVDMIESDERRGGHRV